MIVGTIRSTREKSISNADVNLLGHVDITHSTVSTSERIKFDNPDADGLIFLRRRNCATCSLPKHV